MRGPLDLQIDGAKLDAVKHACEALARATGTSVAYKITTVGGGTVAILDPSRSPGWAAR